jgi:hypothetical protein
MHRLAINRGQVWNPHATDMLRRSIGDKAMHRMTATKKCCDALAFS